MAEALDFRKKLQPKSLHQLEEAELRSALESTYEVFASTRSEWIQQGTLAQKKALVILRKNIARLKTIIGSKQLKGKVCEPGA